MADDLTLDVLNGVLAECGCCPHPTCCPPLVECQSGHASAVQEGFLDPDYSGSEPLWRQTHYLTKRWREQWFPQPDTTSILYWNGGEFEPYPASPHVSRVVTGAVYKDDVQNYANGFRAVVTGSDCEEQNAGYAYWCEISGGINVKQYVGYYSPADMSLNVGLLFEKVYVYLDVSGQETSYHIAWEAEAAAWDAAHPDYPAEVAAYAAWEAGNDAYNDAYQAWLDGGEVGPEPDPFTDPEPTLADPRPGEPDEFYPPCTFHTQITTTRWDIVYAEGGVGSMELVPSTPEEPNPEVSIVEGISVEGVDFSTVELLEEPVTLEEFLALADAWFAAHMTFSENSSTCEPGSLCYAESWIGDNVADPYNPEKNVRFFRYRFKLNKCCAWPEIRSEWDEIFYPKDWLDWEIDNALVAESDPPLPEPSPGPTKTPKVWVWSGVPPRCPEDSASSAPEIDPFDHEPMWSPWSLVVKPPDGEVPGIVRNRNYQQKCYEAPPEAMPQIFGVQEVASE